MLKSRTSSRAVLLATLAIAGCGDASGPGAGSGGAGGGGQHGGASGMGGRGGNEGAGTGGDGIGAADASARDADVVDADAGAADAGDAGPDAGSASPLTVERALAEYTGWTKLMDKPEAISEEIASLCRAPTDAEKQFSDSEHGHDRSLLYWGNAEAAPAFLAKSTRPFPAGAAIVKEKFALTVDVGITLVGKGVMIKRAPGFDPAHGDWEFAYWEPGSAVASGAPEAAYCGGCHASAAATDYVFLDQSWRTGL